MEPLFAGMISRLDIVSDLLSICWISDVFWIPFWECFGTSMRKNGVWKKSQKNESEKVMRKWRSAAEAGASGGGGGFASQLCKEFALPSNTPLLPLNEVRG